MYVQVNSHSVAFLAGLFIAGMILIALVITSIRDIFASRKNPRKCRGCGSLNTFTYKPLTLVEQEKVVRVTRSCHDCGHNWTDIYTRLHSETVEPYLNTPHS